MHKQIGQRIREFRKKRGMLQVELANKVGLSTSAISNFERGRRRASLNLLTEIGGALDVKVSELIPDSLSRKALAENKEEQMLLKQWRKIANTDLQDRLLEVIELSVSSMSRRSIR